MVQVVKWKILWGTYFMQSRLEYLWSDKRLMYVVFKKYCIFSGRYMCCCWCAMCYFLTNEWFLLFVLCYFSSVSTFNSKPKGKSEVYQAKYYLEMGYKYSLQILGTNTTMKYYLFAIQILPTNTTYEIGSYFGSIYW